MVKFVDIKNREEDVLGQIIDSYIEETKPISSAYLCHKYRLNYSSATVRGIMLSLEKQGYLSHIYTSSGRVPTKKGFKRYVENFKEEAVNNYSVDLDFFDLQDFTVDEIINHTLDVLTQFSGYISLLAISGQNEKMFFKGVRFILEQPEFEDINKLKHIFYTLEVRINDLQNLLFDYIDDKIQILIGDDIGFNEISDCSLVISGSRETKCDFAIALLGPMRMNYTKAAACLTTVKNKLKEVVERLV